jgi:pimeloyl-ACP methyl ester carboxylesterase
MSWQAGRYGAEEFRIHGNARPVTGALWLPDQAGPDTPLVFCGHGASGDRYQAPIPHLARRFTDESGFAVLAIDGPVHGLRQIGPGGRAAFAEEMRRPDFVDRMVADWLCAWRAVQARGLGAGRLGYFGLSMGTMFGTRCWQQVCRSPLQSSDSAVLVVRPMVSRRDSRAMRGLSAIRCCS